MQAPPAVDKSLSQTPSHHDRTRLALRDALLSARNSDGGWAYSPGRRSRLEPTCWATLALAQRDGRAPDVATLQRWQRQNDWLIDVAGAPPNNAFNALAALTCLPEASAAPLVTSLVARVIAAKALRLPNDPSIIPQDNTLQAWSWIDGTASWVEPTAWCLLLLKKVHATSPTREAAERIRIGEAMLFDRVCRGGGWNYGNSAVLGQELWAYVPTTAVALLALQDHRDHRIVQQSLTLLQKDVVNERSAVAAAITIVCLRVYGIETSALEQTAVELIAANPGWRQNLLGSAMTLYALTGPKRPTAFTL